MRRTKRLNRKKRPRSRKKSRVRKDTLKRRYAFMRTLKKSKKSKTKKKARKDVVKAGLRKEDSSKYIGLLNLALKHIYQGKIGDVFLSSDNVLWSSGFLEKGMRNGFELMKKGDTQLDPGCNIVCLSNALLSLTILQLDYHELSDLQKLYLFFLDYLNREGNKNRSAYLPFDYAIKKIDKKIETASQYLKKKIDEKAKAKSIKTAQKSIDKLNAELDNYKRSYGRYYGHVSPWVHETSVNDEYWTHEETGEVVWDDPAITSYLSGVVDPRELVDICGSTDCLFLNEEQFTKNPELVKPIEKFCDNLILIFKGIIWLLMKEFSDSDLHLYNTQVGGGDNWCEHDDCLDVTDPFTTKEELEKHMKEVHGDSIVEPMTEPVTEPTTEPVTEPEPEPEQEYSDKITLDLSIHTLLQNVDCVLIPSYKIFWDHANYKDEPSLEWGDPWVYTNLHKVGSEYKMDKMKVSDLKDKFYLTARLHWNEVSNKQTGLLNDFIKKGPNPESIYPILRCIEIEENQLPNGKIVPQLQERIEGSITQHWYVAGQKEIYENVSIQMAV